MYVFGRSLISYKTYFLCVFVMCDIFARYRNEIIKHAIQIQTAMTFTLHKITVNILCTERF